MFSRICSFTFRSSAKYSYRCFSIQTSASTIFAPSTASGKAAISIIRISGPNALSVWKHSTVSPRNRKQDQQSIGDKRIQLARPPERRPVLRTIICPHSKEILDEGLVLYFPAKNSITGQDLIELHLHGSPSVVQAVLHALSTLRDLRPAEPGEFTMRSFENGRMDLTQVEGLRDLLNAETEIQRRLAIKQTGDQLSTFYKQIRSDIITASSYIEAVIDFGEEEQVDADAIERAYSVVQKIHRTIRTQLNVSKRSEILRSGIRLAIFGPPNAGKSTLINWLAKREAAIVSPLPGTTRDVIELSLDFHGFPIILSDTAGIRETTDIVEKIGIERAQKAITDSHIQVLVLSAPELLNLYNSSSLKTGIEFINAVSELYDFDRLSIGSESQSNSNTIVVINKLDQILASSMSHIEFIKESFSSFSSCHTISLKDELQLDPLIESLQSLLNEEFSVFQGDDEPVIAQARQLYHLRETLRYLGEFLEIDFSDPESVILAAESLRLAILSIGKILGRVDIEEILGEIFSSFCIGK